MPQPSDKQRPKPGYDLQYPLTEHVGNTRTTVYFEEKKTGEVDLIVSYQKDGSSTISYEIISVNELGKNANKIHVVRGHQTPAKGHSDLNIGADGLFYSPYDRNDVDLEYKSKGDCRINEKLAGEIYKMFDDYKKQYKGAYGPRVYSYDDKKQPRDYNMHTGPMKKLIEQEISNVEKSPMRRLGDLNFVTQDNGELGYLYPHPDTVAKYQKLDKLAKPRL